MPFLVILVLSQGSLVAANNPCLFNSTHCACREVDTPGKCLRYQGNNYCTVDNCSADGMVCDCSASHVCTRSACKIWVSTNTSVSLSRFPRGAWVSCERKQKSLCLSKIVQKSVVESTEAEPGTLPKKEVAPSPSQMPVVSSSQEVVIPTPITETIAPGPTPVALTPSPSQQPVLPSPSQEPLNPSPSKEPVVQTPAESTTDKGPEFRMVQVGIASNSTMFNMTAFIDKGDFITNKFNMDEMWPNKEYLRRRFINMRLYDSPVYDERMVCAIYNNYNIEDDHLGSMLVLAQISGTAGQLLQWSACDDEGECKGDQSSILRGRHSVGSNSADGWCVKPLEWNGSGIRVKFYFVNGMAGLTLQSSGNTVSDRVFMFKDTIEVGLPGSLNDNGLVMGGAMPDILFNMKGIEVPAEDEESSWVNEM